MRALFFTVVFLWRNVVRLNVAALRPPVLAFLDRIPETEKQCHRRTTIVRDKGCLSGPHLCFLSRFLSSVVRVHALLQAEAAPPGNADDLADSIKRMKDMSLGNVTEGCVMPPANTDGRIFRAQTAAARSNSPGWGSPSSSNHATAAATASAGGSAAAAAASPAPRLSPAQWFAQEERKAVEAYIQDRELEVVVILEGTDTSTGSTVQVRSYVQPQVSSYVQPCPWTSSLLSSPLLSSPLLSCFFFLLVRSRFITSRIPFFVI